MATHAFPSASGATAVQTSRSRAAEPADLAQIHWLVHLDATERQRVVTDLRVVTVEPGELVCRVGRT